MWKLKILVICSIVLCLENVVNGFVMPKEHLDDDHMHPVPGKVEQRYRRQSVLHKHVDYEKTPEFWKIGAQLKLRDQLLKRPNYNIAKNVIIFLGDGMSVPTVTAARIYLGQKQGKTGEESKLFFEDFPSIGLSKTYCVDKQTADSACSATAYLGGVKANFGTIGVNAFVDYDDCVGSQDQKNHVSSIMKWAQKAKKGTGIVTTARITHASPAGAFAHVANRDWESDADVKQLGKDPARCPDIALQLIRDDPGRNFKVILGGGRRKLLPKDIVDEEGNFGQRLDGLNLIDEWLASKNKAGQSAKYVYDKKGLYSLNFTAVDYLLGVFEANHMQYHLDADYETEPSLVDLTVAALEILEKEKNGYVLFIEGGRIDHGHHDNKAKKALDETVEFAEAVRVATQVTSSQDTLIVVTSDHAHTMSISGYSKRGANILGTNTEIGDDQLPYSTLSYANGPSYRSPTKFNGTRELLKAEEIITNNEFQYPALLPLEAETHGADDVSVYALGPHSHLFTGTYEQNVIPHFMAYAACIGDGLTACNKFT